MRDTELTLQDFFSGEPRRILTSCGEILQCWDRDSLRALAPELKAIKAATANIHLGGIARPNSVFLRHALRRISFSLGPFRGPSETCFCILYKGTDFYDPMREVREGHVRVVDEIVDRENWLHKRSCICNTCNESWTTEDNYAGHVPTYRWWRSRSSV